MMFRKESIEPGLNLGGIHHPERRNRANMLSSQIFMAHNLSPLGAVEESFSKTTNLSVTLSPLFISGLHHERGFPPSLLQLCFRHRAARIDEPKSTTYRNGPPIPCNAALPIGEDKDTTGAPAGPVAVHRIGNGPHAHTRFSSNLDLNGAASLLH